VATLGTRSREPILGYEVTERIGAGGYGEVWRATAPGGLTKAIKFVYGFLDDERARRELKALSRVKQVRHPFLLSLERIEVVDGQLVIVTELADMSLKDRNEQCKAAGLVGIPREELLGYLRDAGDALDFMREKYSLQHLDVKPENLLLVGGRVKVADFGLVKDIDDTRASLMGGLTPIYASPEVFDDRPSQCSDQYSLAIVYQELLTGSVPFPGKTTAQLAAQHLQSRPRLTALPPQDKPIIERALAKEPGDRFTSCRAMVDALATAGQVPAESSATPAVTGDTTPLATSDTHPTRPAIAPDALTAGSRTQTFNELRPVSLTSMPTVRPAKSPRQRSQPVIRQLGPLEVAAQGSLRPTLFVGIGGMAGLVLESVCRQLTDRFGPLENLPAFKLLHADSVVEESSLPSARHGHDCQAIGRLRMHLQRPEEYRRGSTKLLSWLSRRWLYNIPRSLETEGLRPLGRLALVDHAEVLVERLTADLQEITAPQAIAATAESAALPIENSTPRIVLVAAISGGTGGGTALDVAYLLRRLLRDRDYADDNLTVLLLHATSRNPAAHELGVANAYGALREFAHYCHQGYPGETAFAIPAMSPAESRLANTYLLELGSELGEAELAAAAANVAEYLYLGTATAAATWLDHARQHSDPAAEPAVADDYMLRTFGICSLGGSNELITQTADAACAALVNRWCGESLSKTTERRTRDTRVPGDTTHSIDFERMAAEQRSQLTLDKDEVIVELQRAAEAVLQQDVDEFLAHEVSRVMAEPIAESGNLAAADDQHPWLREIDRSVGTQSTGDEPEDGSLLAALESHVKAAARQQADVVRQWVIRLIDDPTARLQGALHGVESVLQHVRTLRDTAQKLRARTIEESRALAVQVKSAKPRVRGWSGLGGNHGNTDQQARLLDYAGLRFLDTILAHVIKFAQLLIWDLSTICEELNEARRELAGVAPQFTHDAGSTRNRPRNGVAAVISEAMKNLLDAEMPALVGQMDQQFQETFHNEHGGLWAALKTGTDFRDWLTEALRARSRVAVLQIVRAAAVGQHALLEDAAKGQDHSLLQSCLGESLPRLSECGGDRRLLIVTSDETTATALAQSVTNITSQAPSVVVDATVEPVLCYEIGSLPLINAAASIVDGQPHCAALAARLHTRCDIEWLSLDADVVPN